MGGKKTPKTKKWARNKGAKDRRGVAIVLTARGWRATWIDPDSGNRLYAALWTLGKTTEGAAATWAADKSAEILARKAELAAGAARYTEGAFDKAVELFIASRDTEKESTLDYYRLGASHLVAWAAENGIKETGALTGPFLKRFRTWLRDRKLRVPAKAGGRGARKQTETALSPMTINHRLVITRTMLNEWRKSGLVPKLTSDAIRDNLELMDNMRPVIAFLRAAEIRKLLEATLRHDRETFAETREEHAGEAPPGSTARYAAAGPFLLTVLLTGMRRAEAEGLAWSEVDLGEGRITLDAERVKTKTGRQVDLALSPCLLTLLEALHLRKGENTHVFPEWAAGSLANSTAKRLIREYGAPAFFGWQVLRRTAATFGTNWQKMGLWASAKRCGHSAVMAEARYAGLVTVDATAGTLEAAMGAEDLAAEIVRRAGGKVAAPTALVAEA